MNIKVFGITALNRRVDMICVKHDSTLSRTPMLCMGIFEAENGDGSKTIILDYVGRGLKYSLDETDAIPDNFIGYEYDGVKENWLEEIKIYKDKKIK